MSEKSVVYNPETTKLGLRIGEMIRSVANDLDYLNDPIDREQVIVLLKMCLYDLGADEEIQAALFEYRNKKENKKNNLTVAVKVNIADLEPVKALIDEVACCDFGVMVKHLTPQQAMDKISAKYIDFMRYINESRYD